LIFEQMSPAEFLPTKDMLKSFNAEMYTESRDESRDDSADDVFSAIELLEYE